MARKLTALAVEKATAKDGKRTEIADAGSGLYLIVQPSGVKSWAARYRFAGKPRKLTLGAPESMTLAQARAAVAAALAELAQGRDPGVSKQETEAAERERKLRESGESIEWAAAEFIEKYARKRTREITWKAYERMLRRYVLPAWRGRSVHSIKRRDVIDLIEGIEAPYMANRMLATLSKMFNWLTSRDVIEAPPTFGVALPHQEKARDRVLDDAELARLWSACGKLGTIGDFMRLLMLTGARRGEIGSAEWSEIDSDRHELVIPPERSKNRRRHVIPLVPQAWEIVDRQPRINKYLFPARTGSGSVTGYHHYKAKLGAVVQFDPPIRLHDIRRSVASGLQRLGVSVELIEQILGHVSGVFRGVVGVYQRHDYGNEKRAALQRWADHIEQIVSGEPAKVLPLRGRRR
jgi:integrase